MQLHFLGTGAGMPSKERNTSALAVNLAEELGEWWLIDCGEATQHQILHTTLKPSKLTKIFITHLHGDHIFGLPGLLSSRSFQGGETNVTLIGPSGLQQWVETTLALTGTHLTYELVFIEVTEGIIYQDDYFTVHAAELAHVITSYGYRIEQHSLPGTLDVQKARALGVPNGPLLGQLKRGSDITLLNGQHIRARDVVGEPKPGFILTVLGDTSFCEAACMLSNAATILVHEATFDSTMQSLAKMYGHSTIADAACVAQRAQVQALIVTHISGRFLPQDMANFVMEGATIFPNITIAHDGLRAQLQRGELIIHV